MAISNKGLRTITIKGKKYKWKFNQKVFIMPEENPNGLLVVNWGWWDILEPSENWQIPDPLFATPKFIHEAIEFALANDWMDKTLHIQYKDQIFSMER